MALQFEDQTSILRFVDGHLLLCDHKELAPFAIKLHDGGLLIQPTVEAPPPSDQVEHCQARVPPHGERQLPRRVHGEIVDGLPVRGDGLEEDERVRVEDGDAAVLAGGEEVEREGEGWGREEGEGSCGGRRGGVVWGKGGDLSGGGEVIELDGVVGGGRSGDWAGDGDGAYGGEMGRVGEQLGKGEGVSG